MERISIVSTDEGLTGRLVLQSGSLPQYGEDLKELRFRLYYESQQHLRVRITDMEESRWEVPHVLQSSRIVPHDIVRLSVRPPRLLHSS